MKRMMWGLAASALCLGFGAIGPATAQGQGASPATKAGAACGATSTVAVPDNAVEPKSGRKFVLQYPCDLKKGEKVTLILNIHGFGSSSQYQHVLGAGASGTEIASAYGRLGTEVLLFEMLDRVLPTEDADISKVAARAFGKQNIKSFWLAGHSQGGATGQRIVCSDFFKTKVDGFFSLSGGRVGGSTTRNAVYNAPAPGAPVPASVPAQGGIGATPPAGAAPPAPPAPQPNAAGPMTCDYSHIYDSGEYEIAAMPTVSAVADKFGCKTREARPDLVDTAPGYVWDPSRQNPTRIGWGRQPHPGTAKMWVWKGCKGGRVVADVLRLDKGHTEGLEPKVTEEIVKLIVSAPGGKAQKS